MTWNRRSFTDLGGNPNSSEEHLKLWGWTPEAPAGTEARGSGRSPHAPHPTPHWSCWEPVGACERGLEVCGLHYHYRGQLQKTTHTVLGQTVHMTSRNWVKGFKTSSGTSTAWWTGSQQSDMWPHERPVKDQSTSCSFPEKTGEHCEEGGGWDSGSLCKLTGHYFVLTANHLTTMRMDTGDPLWEAPTCVRVCICRTLHLTE